MKRIGILLVLVLLGISSLGWAQPQYYDVHKNRYVIVKGAYFMPAGKSDLWEYNVELLTFAIDDFNNFAGSLEFGFPIEEHFDMSLEIGLYKATTFTEYRDFIDSEGYAIEQRLGLRIVPIVFSGKFLPIGKTSRKGVRGRTEYRSIIPYIGGGVGLYLWRYEELGDYIDFSDFSIYPTQFLSKGADLGLHLKGGVEVPIGSSVAFMAEISHHIIKAELSEDFVGFEKFDLGGNYLSFGIVLRY